MRYPDAIRHTLSRSQCWGRSDESPAPISVPAASRQSTEDHRENGCKEQRPSSGMAVAHDPWTALMQPAWVHAHRY